MKNKQKGFVPFIVIAALIVSATIGGLVGFMVGDGTFFSFGVGLGAVLVLVTIFSAPLKRLVSFFSGDKRAD
ncbi:hypothetical protein OAF61_00680 [Pseudomonadales bacterium]|nr:hypothetical protein [Pseudomonadales bacterium]